MAGRHVLIVNRFDRAPGQRIGFASALTMLEAADGEQRSYLEIAEVIERQSPSPTFDLRELYRRIIFSILTGNTDDHLRNHAFLRQRRGWALSPAYDLNLNPNPHRPDRLSTAIDLHDTKADIETALSVSGYFRLTLAEARSEVTAVSEATSRWRSEAADLNLPAGRLTLWPKRSRPISGVQQTPSSYNPATYWTNSRCRTAIMAEKEMRPYLLSRLNSTHGNRSRPGMIFAWLRLRDN